MALFCVSILISLKNTHFIFTHQLIKAGGGRMNFQTSLPLILFVAFTFWTIAMVFNMLQYPFLDYMMAKGNFSSAQFTLLYSILNYLSSSFSATGSYLYVLVVIIRFNILQSVRPYPRIIDKFLRYGAFSSFLLFGFLGGTVSPCFLTPDLQFISELCMGAHLLIMVIMDSTLSLIFGYNLLKIRREAQRYRLNPQHPKGKLSTVTTSLASTNYISNSNSGGNSVDQMKQSISSNEKQKTLDSVILQLFTSGTLGLMGAILYICDTAFFATTPSIYDPFFAVCTILGVLQYTTGALFLVLLRSLFSTGGGGRDGGIAAHSSLVASSVASGKAAAVAPVVG